MVQIQIVDYKPEYHEAFRKLNHEWINQYFELEEADNKMLDNPEGYILDKGGYIFMALLNNEVVGTAALIKNSGALTGSIPTAEAATPTKI